MGYSQLGFLRHVLRTVRNSSSNRQHLYSVLQANIDKLDDQFVSLLCNWSITYLSSVEPEEAKRVAIDIGNFSFLIQQFYPGRKAINIEIAIAGYKIAATILTQQNYPEQWINIQNNLGEAYRNRIYGDSLQNLEDAVQAFQNALQSNDPKRFPEKRVMILNNLGLTYRHQEKFEQAIKFHKEALKFYRNTGFSEGWANTQNYLGLAYSDQGNPDKAIAAYKNSLKALTRGTERWADAQNNLAATYREQKKDNRAIQLYKEILDLKVYTREFFAERWAMLHYNLGHAYKEQGHIEESAASYRDALEVFTPTEFPVYCLYAGSNWGHMAFEAERWEEAIDGYSRAINAVEQSRAWALTDNRRTKILEDAISIYINIVLACINANKLKEALEYIERSKARNLFELLADRTIYPQGEFPESTLTELNRLRQVIILERRQLEIQERKLFQSTFDDKDRGIQLNCDYLNQLQQELNNFITQNIQPIDPNFKLSQKIEHISIDRIHALTGNKTTMVGWYIIPGVKLLTFIITPQSKTPFILESSLTDLKSVARWMWEADGYLTKYYTDRIDWQNELGEKLRKLSKALRIEEILEKYIPSDCQQVIFIPHRFLHLLPIHALSLSNEKFLIDRFEQGITYTPSFQLLELTQKKQHKDFQNLFAIQNPTNDLLYADLEVEVLCSLFSSTNVLAKKEATKQAVNADQSLSSAHCSHFACHGEFNLRSPLKSSLILANQERLTLGEIFELNLSQCCLVTLSACETGMVDPTSISDEYIGLPSAFMYAGSPSVVSSLWTVNDLSTTFLMVMFYENLRQYSHIEAGTIAIALNQAQKWLRDLTIEDFEQFLEKLKPHLDNVLAKLRPGQRFIFQESLRQIRQRQPHPFAHPYYWAAFTATGL